MMANIEAKEQQTVAELLGTLGRETGQLLRQEVQLASTEISAKGTRAARGIGVVVAGGALAHAGVIALMAAVVAGMSPFVPIWLSALVLGVLFVGVGYAVLHGGLATLRRIDPVPRETGRQIEGNANATWAKESLR